MVPTTPVLAEGLMVSGRRPPDLTRYADGLTNSAPTQGPEDVDGDPQFSALCEHLSNHRHLGPGQAIIDIGCGEGIVSHAMTLVQWATQTPIYVAIDLDVPLTELSLPPGIHNNSRT